MKQDHDPDCTGWEDCQCFHVTISREEYARILAQRDRLAELLRRLRSKYGNATCMHLEMAGMLNDVHQILAELDKEKQS